MYRLLVLFFIIINVYASKKYEGAVIKPNYNLSDRYIQISIDIVNKRLQKDGLNIHIDIFHYEKGLRLFKNNNFDIVTMMPSTYFENKELFDKNFNSYLTYPINNTKRQKFYLIANKTQKNVLKNLKDYTISISEIQEGAKIFYKTLMYERYKSKAKLYLEKNLHIKSKESKILYDIFFDEKNLGIIPKFSYELIKELNPQIIRKLKILDETEYSILPFIIGITKKLNNNEGKNLLAYLKVDNNIVIENSRYVSESIINPIVYISNEDINETQKVYEEFYKLEKKYKND